MKSRFLISPFFITDLFSWLVFFTSEIAFLSSSFSPFLFSFSTFISFVRASLDFLSSFMLETFSLMMPLIFFSSEKEFSLSLPDSLRVLCSSFSSLYIPSARSSILPSLWQKQKTLELIRIMLQALLLQPLQRLLLPFSPLSCALLSFLLQAQLQLP